MGTGGFHAYRHKGIYYPYFQTHDGYLRDPGLGWELVSQIPSDEQGFKDWLKSKRDFYDGEAEKLRELESSGDGHEDENENERFSEYIFKPSQDFPNVKNVWADWVYVVDLDELLFSVNRGAHFHLANIPRGYDGTEWIYYLTLDGCRATCLRPDTPREYMATKVSARPASKEGLACYNTSRFDVTRIKESAWMAPDGENRLLSPSQVIASTAVRGLLMHHYRDICDYCCFPETIEFKELAEILLRVAAPCGISLKEDCSELYYQSCFRRGGVFYRFRGCVIVFCGNLDSEEHVEANVGLAVLHARKTGAEKSTVILWSIRRVAVAIISHTGGRLQVSLSDVYPVYLAFGISEAGLAKGLGILAYYLRPHCVEDAPDLARAVQRARVLQDPALPFEIIFHIMGFVDSKMYDYFQYVSKDLRKEWAAHPRIANYTVLSVASVNKQANSYLPDVTLNVKVDNGPSKQLNLFYTHCCFDRGDGPFDFDSDSFSSCTYPSPYSDRKMHWRTVTMRLPPDIRSVEKRRRLNYQRDAPILSYYVKPRIGLYMLEESNVLGRCDGRQEPDS